ncbi:MAG: L,D-transpeptidase family protein [Brevundimonas sp.]|uniref:L,D-transpeptidase family protein n=1 Tax=Brevundimonas sp. TaxID=1871086 RepID=UPI002488A164|nr:L,D-transpeptidase family protein [Brevundimonas sp.]MDI1328166.1 L,D-transpeptidase family protein [Brevundimonas sp.]
MAAQRSPLLNRRILLASLLAPAPSWAKTGMPAGSSVQGLATDFYAARGGRRSAWSGPARQEAIRALALADRHGLPAPDGLALDEAELTRAILTLADALAHGRVDPTTVETLWEMDRNHIDTPPLLAKAVEDGTLIETMAGLAPQDRGYQGLCDGFLRYRGIADRGGWPAFALGATIEPFASDPRIPAILPRLRVEGDLSDAAASMLYPSAVEYGSLLQEAVRAFQVRHGLEADARIGPATQRALSISAEDRARQIALNLERRRWLKRDVAPERIEVNTAASIMVYWKDGRPVHSMRVVTGDADNPTPSLERPFASVVANPPWTVPTSIARREILPRGPAYLRAHNMTIQNGMVVQRAGPNAALGQVKFELQDSYAIFLHDTPSRGAFDQSFRHLSHGCVRVQDAVGFARLLLAPDPDRLARFDEALDSGRTVRVATGRPIDVRLLYWTAFLDGQGRVAFREDIYRRDTRLAGALGIALRLPRPDDRRADANDVGP